MSIKKYTTTGGISPLYVEAEQIELLEGGYDDYSSYNQYEDSLMSLRNTISEYVLSTETYIEELEKYADYLETKNNLLYKEIDELKSNNILAKKVQI